LRGLVEPRPEVDVLEDDDIDDNDDPLGRSHAMKISRVHYHGHERTMAMTLMTERRPSLTIHR
jgi:hypothetical protein